MQTTAEGGDRTTVRLSPSGESLSAERCGDPQGLHIGTFDRVLCGMVRVGLVQEAICRLLLLTNETLSFHLVRLNLPTPSERLMRKPSGKRSWSDEEVRLLIKLWTAELRTSAIAERIGRSAGSIRSKARRLGLYRRNRRDLIKTILATEQAADTAVPPVSVETIAEVIPEASPGLLALSPNTTISIVPVSAVKDSAAPISPELILASTNGIGTQFAVSGIASAPSDTAPGVTPDVRDDLAEPSAQQATKSAGMTIKRQTSRRIVWTDELSEEVARRWFAHQHHRGIAEDLGLTEAQVRSHATALNLPRRERKKLEPDYVEGRPYDRTLENSMVKRRCNFDHRLFWSTKNGPHTSPRARKTERYKALHSGFGEAHSTISVG